MADEAVTMQDNTEQASEHPEPSRADRVKALIDGYAHGLLHNAPRTQQELDEMKALLA